MKQQQSENTPIIKIQIEKLELKNCNLNNVQFVIGNNNSTSQIIKDTEKKNFSFLLKLQQMLAKFVNKIDVNIIATLLAMVFTKIW